MTALCRVQKLVLVGQDGVREGKRACWEARGRVAYLGYGSAGPFSHPRTAGAGVQQQQLLQWGTVVQQLRGSRHGLLGGGMPHAVPGGRRLPDAVRRC